MDLFGLVRSLKEQGLQTPCLFRFPDIISHRITLLQSCFDRAINRYEYQVNLAAASREATAAALTTSLPRVKELSALL